MKILIFHHCDSWGGAGVSLIDLCVMLKNQNSITVCVPHIKSDVVEELRKLTDINIISIEENMGMISAYNGGPKNLSRTFFKNYFQIFKNKKKIESILNDTKYDVVLLNSITLSWISKIAKNNKLASVCFVRETAVINVGFKISCMNLQKYCSGVIFISEFDKESIPLRGVHTTVIRDCFDFDDLVDRKKSNNSFQIAFLGGDDPLKGYSILLGAMKLLENYPIKLVVAGNVRSDLQVQSGNISYVGKVSDVSNILSESDVLVFPSVKGHQGRPIFEAGAYEVPVIVSDFPQTANEVINYSNGLTFIPNDASDLANKIIWMYYHPKERLSMGKKNKLNTMENHSIKKNAIKLNLFLNNIEV